MTALVGLPLLLLVTLGLVDEPHAAEKFLWLFSYDYIQSPMGRPWPAALDFSTALTVFAVLFGLGTLLLAVPRARAVAVWTLPLAAVAFTFFVLDDTMPKVAPYWSQKGPIAAYYRLRRSPDERLVAYMLYWRGETFYTSNEIYDGPSDERTVFDQEGADDRLKGWLERHRGRRVFFLFERYQQGRIQRRPAARRPRHVPGGRRLQQQVFAGAGRPLAAGRLTMGTADMDGEAEARRARFVERGGAIPVRPGRARAAGRDLRERRVPARAADGRRQRVRGAGGRPVSCGARSRAS